MDGNMMPSKVRMHCSSVEMMGQWCLVRMTADREPTKGGVPCRADDIYQLQAKGQALAEWTGCVPLDEMLTHLCGRDRDAAAALWHGQLLHAMIGRVLPNGNVEHEPVFEEVGGAASAAPDGTGEVQD